MIESLRNNQRNISSRKIRENRNYWLWESTLSYAGKGVDTRMRYLMIYPTMEMMLVLIEGREN